MSSSAKAKRIQVIRESITKIAKILTDDKVSVTQAGVQAFVKYDEHTMKPSRVNLPMIPDDASDELIDAVQGFLDGEIAKVLYADPRSALRSKYEKLEGIYKPIESLFCEKSMTKAFPGSRQNLNHMHQAFVDKFIEPKLKEALANGASEQQLFQVLAIPALRAWGGQEFFKDYMSDKWSLIAGIQKELDPIASKIGSMTKPEDAYEMAKQIRNVVEGEPLEGDGHNPFGDENKSKSGKGKGGMKAAGGRSSGRKNKSPAGSEEGEGGGSGESDEEEEGSSSGGKGSGSGSGEEEERDEEGSSGEEGEGEEAPEEREEGEEEGEESEDEDEEAEGKSDDEESDDEPHKLEEGADGHSDQSERKDMEEDEEVIQSERGGASMLAEFDWNKVQDMGTEFAQHVTELCTSEMENETYTIFTREWDQIEPPKIPSSYSPAWMTEIEKAIDGMVGPVARQLERAFTARNKSLWQQGQNKGKMSANNLYRLTAGDDKIFKKKIEHRTRDVAVSLVVDCSGSMSGRKIFTAMCAAWVVSEVLTRLGVANEVIGFTTGDYDSDEGRKLYRELSDEWSHGRSWDRTEPIRMPVFKSFDERFGIEQKKRMASYYHIRGALQNNVDGESVQYAYERLCKAANKGKPKGKMMIVFSDGMPAASVSSSKLNNHLKQTVARIEKEGTNIVGIGICSDSVSHFYRKNVKLDNVEELPGIVLNQLRDALMSA